jgi:hypothetical protein
MWSFQQIADSATADLMLATKHPPQTLYEIHQLAELARRAVRGEAPLEEVVRRVVAASNDRELIFGAPSGYLAAGVLVGAPEPIRSSFWSTASRELDARSLATLRSQFREASPPPTLPVDANEESTGEHEQWVVTVYGATDELKVVSAVQRVALSAKLMEHWAEFEPPAWIFEIPAGADSRVALGIALEVANATGAQASCDVPAAMGALGPDVVAFCRPGGEPALGRVEGDPSAPVFTPMDLE